MREIIMGVSDHFDRILEEKIENIKKQQKRIKLITFKYKEPIIHLA